MQQQTYSPTYELTYQYIENAFDKAPSLYLFERKVVLPLLGTMKKMLEAKKLPFSNEEIRYALVHFYAAKGIKAYVVVDKKHRILIRKKVYDLDNNLYIDLFSRKLEAYQDKLEQDKKQENIFLLEYGALSGFLVDILDIENENVRTEIIKRSIKEGLKLGENDAVLLRNDKIAIRRSSYVKPESGEPDKPQQDTRFRRYEGLSPEELDKYYHNLNAKHDFRTPIMSGLEKMFAQELNFKKIDNFYFAKNFIPLFQKLVYGVIEKLVDEDKVFLDALTNFILRQYFDEMLFVVARRLIELMVKKESNAVDFVKFYNGDTAFAADGTRYTKPMIVDSENKRWNASTLAQVAMQRRNGLETIRQKKTELQKTEESVAKCADDIHRLQAKLSDMTQTKEDAEKNAAEAYQEVSRLKTHLVKLRTAVKDAKGERKEQLDEEIRQLSAQIRQHTKKDEELFKIKRSFQVEAEKVEIKITTLKREYQTILKKQKVETEKLEKLEEAQKPLEEKYVETISLLAKTLPKFRVSAG